MTSLQQQPLPLAACAPSMSASAPSPACEVLSGATVPVPGELTQQVAHQRSCSESEAAGAIGCERKRRGSTGGARVWSANIHSTSRLCGSLGATVGRDLFGNQDTVNQQPHSLDYTALQAAGEHDTCSTSGLSIADGSCRFPKLEECAHFHYERVELGGVTLRLMHDEDTEHGTTDDTESVQGGPWFTISVESGHCSSQINNQSFSSSAGFNGLNSTTASVSIQQQVGVGGSFALRRSLENLALLDELLHRCVYDRRVSGLQDITELKKSHESGEISLKEIKEAVDAYLSVFSTLADDRITCAPALTWMRLDNRGRRLLVADGSLDSLGRGINTPAVGAAYGVRRYVAQARDELSFEVGDMISVIDMPSPAESAWWRGKRGFDVGFFPQTCVATIGDKVPRNLPMPAPLVGSLDLSPSKPVLRKHGKLIAFFRSFILSRPSRRRLKQSGILRERVFSCDLGEHLLNSGHDIPMVLKCCAEFIEKYGLVDGVYRLSGITSNIQKLRRAFDEEREPDLTHPDILQDIHSVSSLLKMYFRELPNPLCTYQLYHSFVEAVQSRLAPGQELNPESDGSEDIRLRLMREAVQKLPPPHYRTLRYLTRHLCRVSQHGARTGMTARNIAIVWAPNLLRCARLEGGGVAALQGVGVQAVVTEFLIMNSELLFSDTPCALTNNSSASSLPPLPSRPKSLAISTPTKLLSLEEARSRHLIGGGVGGSGIGNVGVPATAGSTSSSIPIHHQSAAHRHHGGYIEVGGGPSSLPDKYHTILPLPRGWHKRASKRSPTGWRALFTRGNTGSSKVDGQGGDAVKRDNEVDGGLIGTDTATEMLAMHLAGSAESLAADQQNGSLRGKQMQYSSQATPTAISALCGATSPALSSHLRCGAGSSSGHSRSVSHDSYFDILTAEGVGRMAVGELSELRLNFDLEEPEMRIFSEDESLVSSPKVGSKEQSGRRIQNRSRLEDNNSALNSPKIPSPKKQPRTVGSPNGSLRKRYKLEDQLSDIQFIDCATPEHISTSANNQNQNVITTVYATVQVHRNPSDEICNDNTVNLDKNKMDTELKNERVSLCDFSRPISNNTKIGNNRADRYSCFEPKTTAHFPDLHENKVMLKCKSIAGVYNENPQMSSSNLSDKNTLSTNSINSQNSSASKLSPNYHPLIAESDSENSEEFKTTVNLMGDITRANSSSRLISPNFTTNSDRNNMTLDLKVSPISPVTPQISENFKSLNFDESTNTTPVQIMDRSIYSETTSQSNSPGDIAYENLNRISTISSDSSTNDTKIIQNIQIKDTTSVYENVILKKTGVIYENVKPTFINVSPTTSGCKSPIKSTISITYNLKSPIKLKSNLGEKVSSPEIERQEIYESFKRYKNRDSCQNGSGYENVSMEQGLICYDAGVPTAKADLPSQQARQPDKKVEDKTGNKLLSSKAEMRSSESSSSGKQLLETNLDDVMNDQIIYQTVKIYKNAVSEVNNILGKENILKSTEDINQSSDQDVSSITYSSENNGASDPKYKLNIICAGTSCIEDENPHNSDVSLKSIDSIESSLNPGNSTTCANISNIVTSVNDECSTDLCNVKMDTSDADFDETDSLECDIVLSKQSEVDNVDSDILSKSKASDIIEPMDIEAPVLGECLDRLTETKHKTASSKVENRQSREMKLNCDLRPSNFIVKQLATKFELSPVESPVFSFNPGSVKNNSLNKNSNINDNRNVVKPVPRTRNSILNKEKAGSLDESAFSREFSYSSNIQIPIDNSESVAANPTRRKSFDSSRAKLLNQPKTLPNLQNANCSAKDKFNLNVSLNENLNEDNTSGNSPEKLTPCTENKILLIQHNTHQKSLEQLSTVSTDLSSNLDSLDPNVSSLEDIRYKLTRERIEKYKQERRTFLRDKYRSESFRGENKDHSLSKYKNKIDKSSSDSNVTDSLGNVTKSDTAPVHTNRNSGNVTNSYSRDNTYSLDRGKKNFTKIKNRSEISHRLSSKDSTSDSHVVLSDNFVPKHGMVTSIPGPDVILRMTNDSTHQDTSTWDRRSLDSPGRQKHSLNSDRRSLSERERLKTNETRDNRTIQRDKCSPSVCIRDVAAIFESRSNDT